MTLPLMPAAAGSRSAWRRGCAALVLAVAVLVAGPAVVAQEPDPFSATVKVDATADNAAKARETARIDGQRRALAALAEKLGGGGAAAKLPKLDDKAIADLVASFEVANERMSAVRYLADYTFHFRPAAVQRVLGTAGIAVGTAPASTAATAPPPGPAAGPRESFGKPLVLLPVFESGGQPLLWEEPNPWRERWERQPGATGGGRIIVPLGDAGDIAAIDAAKARAADPEALAAVARHNGSEEAVVATAAPRGPADRPTGVEVTLRRYRAGQPVDSRSETLAANPGESASDLMGRAVAAIASNIDAGWKKEPAAKPEADGPLGNLTAVLPIASLDDWVRARERLGSVPGIRKVDLTALTRQEATIEIGYVGGIDQLRAGLAGISLDLVRGDPLWRLARTGSARTQ